MGRVDRYYSNGKASSRTLKNQNLYQDLKDYTNLKEEVIIEPVIEIDLNKKETKREVKHQDIINKNIISPLYKDEKKEYDINKVLNNAKENRKDIDELEEKRHLKKDEYNIAKNIDLKNLDKYKKNKDGLNNSEKEELKELINKIYSNNLKDDIKKKELENQDKDLFSDLMPDVGETIIDEDMASRMIEEEKKEMTNELKNVDDSFFTTSLGLNVDDFVDNDNEDDMDNSFVEEKDPKKVFIIIGVILFVLIVLGILCYFIYQSI